MSARVAREPNKVEDVNLRGDSQTKLVDAVNEENGDDGVLYLSEEVDEEPEEDLTEEKPKIKRWASVKAKVDESSTRDFVRSNISQRRCCSFVPTKDSRDVCQCGLKHMAHDPVVISQSPHQQDSKTKWEADSCTEKVPSNCFGLISFDGFGQEASRKAPYVRVDYQTDPDVLCELLKLHWNIPEPKLIISITGGAKRLFIKSRLMNSFRRGLINAATAADAWIVTGGTNTGVMEIVGDAVHDYTLQMGGTEKRIILLGIATWGYIANKTSLVVSEEVEDQDKAAIVSASGNTYTVLVKDVQNEAISVAPDVVPVPQLALAPDVALEVPNPMESPDKQQNQPPVAQKKLHRAIYKFDDLRSVENQGRVSLNPFHTHFILVDNGTDGKPGFEINLRANIEQRIAKQCEGQVILIVLEGGEKTLETASEAIDRATPVVIIKGSGRAADVIAHAYYKHNCIAELTCG